jgi:predicted transposase YdaD
MRQRYDASSKWLIENYSDAILRLAGVTDLVSFRPMPGEVVQSRQLPDGLVEVVLLGHPDPVVYLIEINTYPDSCIPTALFDDVLMTYLNRGRVPEVVTLTLCQRGSVVVSPTFAATSPLGGTGLTANWRVVNLWELAATDFLPLTDPGLAPWVPLTRIDGPPEVILQQCRDVIDEKTVGNTRVNLLAVTQILGGLALDPDLLKRIFRRDGNMIESPILTELFMEKELETRRADLMEFLEEHFGTVPADVFASIRLVADQARLKRLLRFAYSAPTLDEFRAELAK